MGANRVVSIDRLVDVVWGDRPPPTAQVQIQKVVSELRRLLIDPADENERIVTAYSGYMLRAEPGEIDAEVFKHEVRLASSAATRRRMSEAATHFRAALSHWFGQALDGVPGLAADAIHLEEQRLAALEDCIRTELQLGREGKVAPELEQLITAHPLRERLRMLHMVALCNCGRRAEALRVYHDTRRVLREELGIEPSSELRDVEQAVLSGAPAVQLAFMVAR